MKRTFKAAVIVTLLLWVAAAALLCENALKLAPHFRPSADPALARWTAEESQCRWQPVEIAAADGARLRAWWFEPPHAKGSALLIHGVADSRRGVLACSRILLRHGYRVLAADSRAHGESGGAMLTHGLLEVNDVRLWVDWIRSGHPAEPVFGLGESMGAAILLQAAGHGVPFRAIVAESPFASLRAVARYRVRQKAGPIGPALADSALLYARFRYGLDFSQASPEAVAAGIHVPVLLIHGPQDTNVPQAHSLRLAARNPSCITLWAPPGVPHTAALAKMPAEFERRVAGHFSAPPPQACAGP